MLFRNGLTFALGASLVLGACASAGGAGAAGAAAATPGRETKFSSSATLALAQAEGADSAQAQQFYQQALAQAQQGIAADANNPRHYLLAGNAQAGLGSYAEANSMWTRAAELAPAMADEVRTSREQAWAKLFNAGVVAYNAGSADVAIRSWEAANQIYDARGESYLNLAAVYTQQEQYDRAVAAYRGALAAYDREPGGEMTPEETAERAANRQEVITNLGQLYVTTERYGEAETLYRELLAKNPNDIAVQSSLAVALSKQGKKADALQSYDKLLASPQLSSNDMFNVGVGLFQIEEYDRAAKAFRGVTEQNPNNRDAWYNLVNALYAQEKAQPLVPVAERLMQLDPLNENAALILARAYRDTKQNQKALATLESIERAPVFVDNLQLRTENGRSVIRGSVTSKAARAGSPVQLRFTFYGPSGELGTQTVTVNAPAAEQSANFEAALESPTPATGYRYQVVG